MEHYPSAFIIINVYSWIYLAKNSGFTPLIPIGLNVSDVDFVDWVNKEQQMIYCSACQIRNTHEPFVCFVIRLNTPSPQVWCAFQLSITASQNLVFPQFELSQLAVLTSLLSICFIVYLLLFNFWFLSIWGRNYLGHRPNHVKSSLFKGIRVRLFIMIPNS